MWCVGEGRMNLCLGISIGKAKGGIEVRITSGKLLCLLVDVKTSLGGICLFCFYANLDV